MESHMENENENRNIKEEEFKKEVYLQNFPKSVKDEFIAYWTEPNKSGTKMRFEMEKTWELKRRLSRWASNDFGRKVEPSPKPRKSSNVDRILNTDYTKYKPREKQKS